MLVFEVEEEGILDKIEILILVDIDLYLFDWLEEVDKERTVKLLEWHSSFVFITTVKHGHKITYGLAFPTNLLVTCFCLLFIH